MRRHPARPSLLARWRQQLAPSGSRREWLGRRLAQTARGAHRRARMGIQGLLRSMNIAIPPSIPQELNEKLWHGSPCYDVLCLPVFDWTFRFQRPQQLMREFARAGHRVFYISHDFLLISPLAVETLDQDIYGVRLRGDAGRSVLDAPLAGDEVFAMADGVARLRATSWMRAAVVIVQHPFWAPLALRLSERFGWKIVYDCMDDYAALYRCEDGMAEMERTLIQASDLMVASSSPLLAKAAEARRAALVRNGGDYEHFCRVEPAAPGANSIVLGYYGAIAHWFDGRLVAALARLRPEWEFQLIGNTYTADLKPLDGLRNVKLLGEVPYADLPARMASWHCCMIPFQRNELTEATNPVKVYEMLAAGMPVVAVDLPELRPIAAEGLIQLADDAEGFARAADELLARQSPEGIALRRAFARKNTWQSRLKELAAAIEPLLQAPAVPVCHLPTSQSMPCECGRLP